MFLATTKVQDYERFPERRSSTNKYTSLPSSMARSPCTAPCVTISDCSCNSAGAPACRAAAHAGDAAIWPETITTYVSGG